jgi:ribulose-phosphate 3-epimerase
MESTRHIHRALQMLAGAKSAADPSRTVLRGVALNPGTPLEALAPLISEIDMVVLLAINPGWSGQKLTPEFCERILRVKRMLHEAEQSDVLLAVDGGVTRENISMVSGVGADLVVTGSAVFDGKAVAENARYMLDAVRK